MTDTVIITGSNIEVDHQATGQPDPKRRRPVAYNPPAVTLEVAAIYDNPFWTIEANDYADTNPHLRPKDLARQWRRHRIESDL